MERSERTAASGHDFSVQYSQPTPIERHTRARRLATAIIPIVFPCTVFDDTCKRSERCKMRQIRGRPCEKVLLASVSYDESVGENRFLSVPNQNAPFLCRSRYAVGALCLPLANAELEQVWPFSSRYKHG